VDCSNRGLKEIPMEIPTTTTKLVLSDNFIKKIPAFGLFNRFFTLLFLADFRIIFFSRFR
jgi:hypothetical protein